MENIDRTQLQEAQRAAARAEMAPWTDYPRTPAWYPASVGAWGAAFTLSFALDSLPLRLAAVLALVAVEGAFLAWYRRYRGAMPTGAVPPELRSPIAALVAALVALAGVATALGLLVTVWVAALVVLVALTALTAWYERAYARATARTRARLA